MQRTQLQSAPRPSVRCWMSPIQSQDYFDVSPHPSGRCTVLYGSTEQTSKPLLISHCIVYLQGAETTCPDKINMYKPDLYVWKYELCCNIMISEHQLLFQRPGGVIERLLGTTQWNSTRVHAWKHGHAHRRITLEVITRTCFYAWDLWQCSVPQQSLSLSVQWGRFFSFLFSINGEK